MSVWRGVCCGGSPGAQPWRLRCSGGRRSHRGLRRTVWIVRNSRWCRKRSGGRVLCYASGPLRGMYAVSVLSGRRNRGILFRQRLCSRFLFGRPVILITKVHKFSPKSGMSSRLSRLFFRRSRQRKGEGRHAVTAGRMDFLAVHIQDGFDNKKAQSRAVGIHAT